MPPYSKGTMGIAPFLIPDLASEQMHSEYADEQNKARFLVHFSSSVFKHTLQ